MQKLLAFLFISFLLFSGYSKNDRTINADCDEFPSNLLRGPYFQINPNNSQEMVVRWRSSIDELGVLSTNIGTVSAVSQKTFVGIVPVVEEVLCGEETTTRFWYYEQDTNYDQQAVIRLPEDARKIQYNLSFSTGCVSNKIRNGNFSKELNLLVAGDCGMDDCKSKACEGTFSDQLKDAHRFGGTNKNKFNGMLFLGDQTYGSLVNYEEVPKKFRDRLKTVVVDNPNTQEDETLCAEVSIAEDGLDYSLQNNFFNVLNKYLGKAWIIPTIGNHESDYSWQLEKMIYDKKENEEGSFEIVDSLPKRWNIDDYFGAFISGDRDKGYFSMQQGDVLFITLNSELRKAAFKQSGKRYSARLEEMVKWFKGELERDTKWKIVSMHHPIHSAGSRRGRNTYKPFYNSERECRAEEYCGWDSVEEAQLIDAIGKVIGASENDVDLVLYGHNHIYERSFLVDGYYSFRENAEDNGPDRTISVMAREGSKNAKTPMQLLSDGCAGCYEEYIKAKDSDLLNDFDYRSFNKATFVKEGSAGTVFVMAGNAGRLESIDAYDDELGKETFSASQDFFNHPIMRPFRAPVRKRNNNTRSESAYRYLVDEGRGLNLLGTGQLTIRENRLTYRQIGRLNPESAPKILDQFTIIKN